MLLASLALMAGAAAEPPLPLDRAKNVLEEARLACAEDGGALWGLSLCGPLLLVDPESRLAVANEADEGGVLRAESGVFAGVLPSDVVVANTATRWSGKLWTMVMWQSIGPRPAQQRRLLMHESGPAYGLLLDATDAGWRRTYKASSDLAATLGAAAKATPAADPVERARAYDDGSLRASEEERARVQAARVAAYRARLVDGPVLAIPLEIAQYGFDPTSVVAFGDAGTVYPSLEVSGPWGTIRTDEGARVDAARGVLLLSAADRTRLKLNAGWVLTPGVRPGDLLLSASPKD